MALKTLRPDQLKPGMVVKRDVVAFSGEVLLYSGNTLKENDIKSVKSWGVVDVVIDDTEGEETIPTQSTNMYVTDDIVSIVRYGVKVL